MTMNMTVKQLEKYLENHIKNWYYNSFLDYGINGRFIRAEVSGNDLTITWEEKGQRFRLVVVWYTEYTPEQVYNIWAEGNGAEKVAA